MANLSNRSIPPPYPNGARSVTRLFQLGEFLAAPWWRDAAIIAALWKRSDSPIVVFPSTVENSCLFSLLFLIHRPVTVTHTSTITQEQIEPTNQPTDRPTDQPTNQPSKQASKQPTIN